MSNNQRDKALAQLDAFRRKAASAQAGLDAFLAKTRGERSTTNAATHGSTGDTPKPAAVVSPNKPARKPRAYTQRQQGDLLNEHDVAARLSKSVQTIRRWRMLHRGPKFFKVGANVRYKPEDVDAWLNAQPSGGEQLKKGK